MPKDFYGEDEEAAPSGAQTPAAPDDAEDKQEDEGGETAMIPKSLLRGKKFKPGEEVVLEIVHMYEDEVEVRYGQEKKGEEPDRSQMESSEGDLEKMGKPMAGY